MTYPSSRRVFTAFAVTLAALIPLYVPLLSVEYYVKSLSEVVYEGSSYRVVYKSPILPLGGNATSLVLEVKRNGKPLEFGFTLSGVTVDGARDIVRGKGDGRVKVDISTYVDDVVRVLRDANANPAFNSVSILAFIVSKVEENGEEYVATNIVTIPIIPAKARGKEVRVEVEFKPVHKVKLNKSEIEEVASTMEYGRVEPLTVPPPSTIQDYCVFYPFYPKPVMVCYYWKLNTTYYKTPSSYPDQVPLSISYIDPIDGDYVKRVVHYHYIELSTTSATKISFDLALVFKNVIEFIVSGPGFERSLSQGLSSEVLLSLYCPFSNTKLTSDISKCSTPGGGPSYGPYTFYDEALVATGLWGYMWLVEYNYVRDVISGGLVQSTILDKSLAVWFVPLQGSDGKFRPSIMVDDNPYDGVGFLENVFREIVTANTTWKQLPSKYDSVYQIIARDLLISSSSTPLFGVAIPIGAAIMAIIPSPISGWAAILIASLTVGISVSKEYESIYINLALTHFEAVTNVNFNPMYLELTAYLVKEADGKYYRSPFMVLRPFVT